MILDLDGEGLEALFPPHVVRILQWMWSKPKPVTRWEPVGSREVYEWFKEYAEGHGLEGRSRTSIINSLKMLEKTRILDSVSQSCKGGYRELYYPRLSPQQFDLWVKEMVQKKLNEIFTGFAGGWWKLP